jgi:hypothetical protein
MNLKSMVNDPSTDNNFKVVVRVRPPLPRELPAKSDKDVDGCQLEFLPIT